VYVSGSFGAVDTSSSLDPPVFPRCGPEELTLQIDAVNDWPAFWIAFFHRGTNTWIMRWTQLTERCVHSSVDETDHGRCVLVGEHIASSPTAMRGPWSHLWAASDGKLTHSCHPCAAKPMAWRLAVAWAGVVRGIQGRWEWASQSPIFFQGSRRLGRTAVARAGNLAGTVHGSTTAMSADPRHLGKEWIFDLAGLRNGW
jgi:hypothetical protein